MSAKPSTRKKSILRQARIKTSNPTLRLYDLLAVTALPILMLAACKKNCNCDVLPKSVKTCNIVKQSSLKAMNYTRVDDHSLYVGRAFGDFRDSTQYNFAYVDSSKIIVRGLRVLYPNDSGDPNWWDSTSIETEILLNDSGYAYKFYETAYPEYPSFIDYDNGRVTRVWSEFGFAYGNFEYDNNGNLVKLVADDITSLSNEETFEYGQDSVKFFESIHPTDFAGWEFFVMQVMHWVPPMEKYRKTRYRLYNREENIIEKEILYSSYETSEDGRITSFKADNETVKLDWKCRLIIYSPE